MPDVKAARELNQGHYRKKDVFVNPASNRYQELFAIFSSVLHTVYRETKYIVIVRGFAMHGQFNERPFTILFLM